MMSSDVMESYDTYALCAGVIDDEIREQFDEQCTLEYYHSMADNKIDPGKLIDFYDTCIHRTLDTWRLELS